MENGAPPIQPSQPRRRGLIVSIGLNVVQLVAICILILYAFMLNVDLGDVKRRLSKEVETRQLTEGYLVETRNQLTDSLHEVEQLKAQLAYKETDYQAKTSALPALPVVVNFRSSILGKGLVAVIQNTSDRYLTVILAARNPALSVAKRFKLELDPKASTDFGHLEGWQFAAGDELSLYSDGFGTLNITVP